MKNRSTTVVKIREKVDFYEKVNEIKLKKDERMFNGIRRILM